MDLSDYEQYKTAMYSAIAKHDVCLRQQIAQRDERIAELEARLRAAATAPAPKPKPKQRYYGRRMTIAEIAIALRNSGNKAKTFTTVLRYNMLFPNNDINPAFNHVLKTTFPEVTLERDDVHPSFWKSLGRNEDEKTENALLVMEFLYDRAAQATAAAPRV
jgi:hypothetical protein